MTSVVETAVTLPKPLFDQAEALAQQLAVTPEMLFTVAIEEYVLRQARNVESAAGQRLIHRGDIYWVTPAAAGAWESTTSHPYVVVQDDIFNHSRVATVVACALTSNLARMSETPGNILLEPGEANLPRQSVVEVSKVSAIEKTALGVYIGALSSQRVEQILRGLRFLQMAFLAR